MKKLIFTIGLSLFALHAHYAFAQLKSIKLNSNLSLHISSDASSLDFTAKQKWVKDNFPGEKEQMLLYVNNPDWYTFIENDVVIFVHKTPYALTLDQLNTTKRQKDLLYTELFGPETHYKTTSYTINSKVWLISMSEYPDAQNRHFIILDTNTSTAINGRITYANNNKAAGEAILRRLPEIIHFN